MYRTRFVTMILMSVACLSIGALTMSTASAPPTTAPSTMPASPRPLVGAIRWDAWYGPREVPGKAVQESLGPKKWHDRLPFYAKAEGDDRVAIDGATPDVMAKEIAYAHNAGLDYWAFVTYPPETKLSLALKLYLESPKRGDMKFCLITEHSRWKDDAYVARLADLVAEKGYVTVADGRPLLYMGFLKTRTIEKNWGSTAGFRKVIDRWKRSVESRGLKTPYVVIMDFSPEAGKRWVDELGCDAVSSYAVPGQAKGAPYAELAKQAEAFWEHCRKTGADVVPIVTSGWDRRPRVERPVPWETWQKPGEGIEKFYKAPTPKELAEHLQSSLTWIEKHREQAPANAVIIYAWNETDEGGWLVPTHSEGTARLDAIERVLKRIPNDPAKNQNQRP